MSGLWTCAFTFGSFLSPNIGGSLLIFGFTGSTDVLQGWSAVMLVKDVFVLCYKIGEQPSWRMRVMRIISVSKAIVIKILF